MAENITVPEEFSLLGSDSRSSDNDVPLHTRLWTRTSMDKLGVVVRFERSPLSIIVEWGFNLSSVLSEYEASIVNMMLPKTVRCLENMDFTSVEEMRDAVKLFKLINFDTDCQFPGSHLAQFRKRAEDFLFTLTYIIDNIEEENDILDSQYQILFDKFLQMFGITTMQQPFMRSKKSLIMGKTVHSQPDLLCFTPDPSRKRPVLAVCEVKRSETVGDTSDTSGHNNSDPPKKKLRSLSTAGPSEPAIPDWRFAPHIGELFVHMDKSVSTRAVLGMTVDQTHVRFTLLIVNERTMEKLKTFDGRGPLHFEGLLENPRFYYSKQLNYLKKDEREEFLKCLLHIGMMQNRFK